MRFPDLLMMSVNNLRRRKLRTFLTVLGVIIGTASIVVMVSLGIGLNEMTMEQIASWGSLTTIEVYANDNGSSVRIVGGSSLSSSSSKSGDTSYITDEVIADFQKIPYVTGVSPVLEMNVLMRQGAYEAQYISLTGVSQSYLEQLNLGEGRIPASGEMGMVFGNGVLQRFTNAKTGKGYWDTGELPDVDLMGKPVFVVFDMDAYATPRKTSIENVGAAVYEEKKAEAMEVVALIDRFGYAKTIDKATFERNKEAALSESKYVISCMNTDKACIFTDTGRLHLIKITDMPFGRFRDKSIPLDNLGNYDSSGENIIHICNLASIQDSMMLFATKTGMLKLVKGSEFDVSKRTVAATKLADGDSIIAICTADNFNQLVLQTENGYFIRFPMMNIPEMKKTAIGVRGISLGSGDSVKAAYPLDSSQECTIIHNEKELLLNKLKLVNRGGKGTKVRI